ncbi:Hpt domain-containing protein [Brevundimonas lenta]|uniref:HPt (Histidine-containing phosphotransfer) domain-containing protein n=1 Tax=Brevundimonas lenta TaxID=424796 RepID=A0A7W6JFP4_9CAUL|nr:HPt (histidine-containing phosphotransfer) domain-containing protein [Brevundimonas lenta]
MTRSDQTGTADPLAPLRARFRERSRNDARALKAALEGQDYAAIESIAHGLAGMAGMFGHAELAEASAAIDGVFARGGRPSGDAVQALIGIIDRTVEAPHS